MSQLTVINVTRDGERRADWTWSWREAKGLGSGEGFPTMRDACVAAREQFGHQINVVWVNDPRAEAG